MLGSAAWTDGAGDEDGGVAIGAGERGGRLRGALPGLIPRLEFELEGLDGAAKAGVGKDALYLPGERLAGGRSGEGEPWGRV